MRTRRTHRIGPTEVERLIAGDHPGPEHTGLHHLLDAARAPATEQELAGEKAVVAVFAAHRRRAARTALRTSARRIAVPATAALALLALGGTAYAARTGNLPQEAQQHAHSLFSALGVPAPRTGPTRPSPAPTTPSITALSWCDAWRGTTVAPGTPTPAGPADTPPTAGPAGHSGAAAPPAPPGPLSSENRRRLVQAAGGEDSVPKYCAELRRSASATPAPTGTRRPETARPAPGTAPASTTAPPAPTTHPTATPATSEPATGAPAAGIPAPAPSPSGTEGDVGAEAEPGALSPEAVAPTASQGEPSPGAAR